MDIKKSTLFLAMLLTSAAGFSAEHFVTVNGNGSKDGTSWDNAIDFATMYDNINNYDNGDVFYFAGGTYVPAKVIGISNGYTFVGGFDPSLTGTQHDTPAYPSATPTVFSGDLDGDGEMSDGDLNRLLSFNTATKDSSKMVILRGLEFTKAYTAHGTAEGKSGTETHGALFARNCGYVEVDNCRFYNNVDDINYGGMAFTGQYSTVVFNDCEFTGNKAVSRGGAIRLTSNDGKKGVTVLNRCTITGNSVSKNIGSAIFFTHGVSLSIINSTIADNTSAGDDKAPAVYVNAPDANHKRNVYVVNSTIAGNMGTSQLQVLKDANLHVANSVIVGDGTNPAIATESVKDFTTGGYNVVGSDANSVLTWGESDNAGADNTFTSVFGDNQLSNGVIEPLATSGKYTEAGLAAAVADWGITADLTIDQLGVKRVDGSTPGAYAKSSATGIGAIHNLEFKINNSDVPVYNLSGQRVSKSYKGLVIVNGKKMVR